MSDESSRRAAVERAYRKHSFYPWYLLRDVMWSDAIVPAARVLWRGVERAGPLWAAITAIATAITAWAVLRASCGK